MIPELRVIDFEFLREVQERKTLSQVRDSIEPGSSLSTFQKILKKLEDVGFVDSERIGRERFIKINSNGRYFLKFYLRKISV